MERRLVLKLNAPFVLKLNTTAQCISERYIKITININFLFHTLLWCLKRFYEGLKAFIKLFEALQKKCNNKNLSYFCFLCPGLGREGLI